MNTQISPSASSDLAEDLYFCVHCNDFEYFSALLSQPLVQEIVREPVARFLRRACLYQRWKFVDVLLPYHTDEELGGVLNFCLSYPHLEGFDYILRQRPQACVHVGRSTLKFLVEVHHKSVKTSAEAVRRQALERFLDTMPQEQIDENLSMFYHLCRKNSNKHDHIDAFEAWDAQRQKDRLVRDIAVGVKGPGRKI